MQLLFAKLEAEQKLVPKCTFVEVGINYTEQLGEVTQQLQILIHIYI